MSKKEVLEQIYPDEVNGLLRKVREENVEKEIQRYEGYRHMMIAVAAGMGGKTKDDKTLYEVYNQQLDEIIKQLQGKELVEEEEVTREDIKKNTEILKRKQEVYRQIRVGKKLPEGVR